jgi:hypothetical protein
LVLPLGNGTFFSTKFVWMPSICHRSFTINEELWYLGQILQKHEIFESSSSLLMVGIFHFSTKFFFFLNLEIELEFPYNSTKSDFLIFDILHDYWMNTWL